ncbi:transmembrane protein 30C [Anguilla rostrata]|uniref:transmembrane protein 30C n=1 Tax=Anguilla rostrata TaxID=7938 RepID=UPI0030CC09A4
MAKSKDDGDVVVKPPLSRRPDNSAFKQQRLPAWSPSLTANTVLPFFFFMGALCLFLGVWLLLTVQGTREIKVDYTDAGNCTACFDLRKSSANAHLTCDCIVTFSLSQKFQGNVFFYYGLVNFHQNLRRYMDSRDDGQMVGRLKNLKTPSSYCYPFRLVGGTPVAPCGAVANSMFNDSFVLHYHPSEGPAVPVSLIRRDIAWYTDKTVKFRNPSVPNETLAQVFKGTAQPVYWQKPAYELDPTDPGNNGFINEDLIVWMREAAFPTFKKLYGILNRSQGRFEDGLPAGNYSVSISYNYPVEYFQGRKMVVLSTVSWFGGQNHFLPIAYMVTGGLVLVVAMVLTGVHVKVGRGGLNMEE